MACKVLSLSCWCVIFTINLSKGMYLSEKKIWMKFMYVPMCMWFIAVTQ